MSILIKDMEMPINCENCRFWYQDQDSEHNIWNRCTALNHKEIVPFIVERREDCPLVEVPPHGRLIDADALPHYTGYALSANEVAKTVEAAPTIIEAKEDSHE